MDFEGFFMTKCLLLNCYENAIDLVPKNSKSSQGFQNSNNDLETTCNKTISLMSRDPSMDL